MENGLKNVGYLAGKMALKRSKKHNFPKSAKNTPKSDKRMNQMSIPPFWGVFCGVFGVNS